MPETNPKLSGWLDSLLKITTAALPFVQSTGGGQSNAPQFSVINAVDQLALQLRQVKEQFTALPLQAKAQSLQQALQAVQQFQQAFNSIPATNARDSAYITQFRPFFDNAAAELSAQVQINTSQTPTTQPTGTNQTPVIDSKTGQIIYINGGGLSDEDRKLIIYGAAGLAAILLLK